MERLAKARYDERDDQGARVFDTVSVKQNVLLEIHSNFFPRWPFELRFGYVADMVCPKF